MDKFTKLKKLFNPDDVSILLSSFLAVRQVREELAAFLKANTERELLDELGADFYFLSFRDISQNECSLSHYHGPDPANFDFSQMAAECERHSDRIIVGGLWSAIQGDSSRMMGFENYLLNIVLNKPLVKTLVNRVTDLFLEANLRYFESVRGKMDVFFMGNDFGSQNGLMISEEDWLDLYYENYRKLICLAHDNGMRVMVHSCGGIEPLIPYFIELGVDILDPLQVTANGMEPSHLSSKYGKDLVFHGAVDTQHILPSRTAADVAAHCEELISKLNVYGKYILAPSNNILPETPCSNIMKLYETAKNYR